MSAKILHWQARKLPCPYRQGIWQDETIPSEIRLCISSGGKVDVLIADNTEEIFRKEAAELLLKPKKYILGAGCKKRNGQRKAGSF